MRIAVETKACNLSSAAMQDNRRLRWFALAGLNLPFLITYLIQLPDHEMYWFGPVVWVILTVRYFRRRTTNGEVWQPWNRHLCVCAVALSILLSFLLWSPSYGMLGAALSVGWYLSTRSDRIIYSSMAYLSAALFLTVRVPFLDGGLQWLNQMSVRLTGILLDVTGSLNLVTSDYGMSLPGRHFSLADLTHTFLSIPCLLCLCSVFLTFRDRRLLLQLSVLLIALPFSIVLKSIHLFAGATMLNNWGATHCREAGRFPLALQSLSSHCWSGSVLMNSAASSRRRFLSSETIIFSLKSGTGWLSHGRKFRGANRTCPRVPCQNTWRRRLWLNQASAGFES